MFYQSRQASGGTCARIELVNSAGDGITNLAQRYGTPRRVDPDAEAATRARRSLTDYFMRSMQVHRAPPATSSQRGSPRGSRAERPMSRHRSRYVPAGCLYKGILFMQRTHCSLNGRKTMVLRNSFSADLFLIEEWVDHF